MNLIIWLVVMFGSLVGGVVGIVYLGAVIGWRGALAILAIFWMNNLFLSTVYATRKKGDTAA